MKRKYTAILLTLAICLSGCAGGSSKDTGKVQKDKEGAYQTLASAVDQLKEEDSISLQLFGSMSSTYNDSSSMIGISSLFSEKKSEGKVYSVLTMSYTDGTYIDYYNMSDGKKNVCYYDTGSSDPDAGESTEGSVMQETAMKGTEAEQETVQGTADSGSAILSDEEFEKTVSYGNIQIPFTEEAVKEVSTIEKDSGTTWKFVLDPQQGEDLAVWLMESISYIDTSQKEVSFDIDEISCQAGYQEDGSLKTIKYTLDADMTCEGETLSADYSISYIVRGKGADVDVNVPDLSQFSSETEAETAQ